MLREIGETPERIEVGLVKEDADVEHASLDDGLVGRITFEKAQETMVVHQASDMVRPSRGRCCCVHVANGGASAWQRCSVRRPTAPTAAA